MQKSINRIVGGFGSRSSHTELFKKFAVLPVHCQNIFSLMIIVVYNVEDFQTNLSLHGVETRNNLLLLWCWHR
jgi:hypothetical protein